MKRLCFLFVILIFSLSEARTFTDVQDYSWAASVIDEWSNRGIISGYNDGTFKGNNNVKRSEMVAVINKLNNSSEALEIKPARDVSFGDWYCNDMSVALKNGLIELDENYNLRPNEYATREEVFVILAKLFKLKYNGDSTEILSSKFKDYSKISGVNYPYVAALINENYISGYEDNTLKPKSFITRAELIALIDKIVEEVYTFGEFEDKFIDGNVVINGEDVSIGNVNINGYIFIMDGARNNSPSLKNIDTTKGIVSRIGDVFVTGIEQEKVLEEKEIIEPVFMRVKYSEDDWTNDDVEVTITFSKKDYEVINNSGKDKYTFEKNGEFVFIAKNSDGNITEFKAKVNNIDKIKPEFDVSVDTLADKATITIAIKDDELSPIDGAFFLKGANSGRTTVNRGKEIINNVFEVNEEGRYTVVVEDEAGNIGRKMVTIKLGGETSGVQN